MKTVAIILTIGLAVSAVSGFKIGSGRIVGGENTGEREFPHQVSVQYGSPSEKFHSCGGTIYDYTRVITSASCISGVRVENLGVLAGKRDLSIVEGEQQSRSVEKVEYHELYNSSNSDYDIGIITLTEPLVFTPFVQPVRLAIENIEPSGEAIATGWGNIRDDMGIENPSILQKVTLNIIERQTCADSYISIKPVTENMVCAANSGKGTCTSDNGGPLMAKDEANRYYLAGVVSNAIFPCAQSGYPSVFANVGKLRSWLDSKLNA